MFCKLKSNPASGRTETHSDVIRAPIPSPLYSRCFNMFEQDHIPLNSVYNDIPVLTIEFHGPGHDASIERFSPITIKKRRSRAIFINRVECTLERFRLQKDRRHYNSFRYSDLMTQNYHITDSLCFMYGFSNRRYLRFIF